MIIADCEVKFEIICKTAFGEQLIIVGNTPELGNWNPYKGIVMKTDDDNYPNWYTENPLMLQKGSKFQFKFVKLRQGNQEWEVFPNNLNRKYRTRYQSVTLKAVWNDFSGREIPNKKYASSNVFSNNEIKVHKFKISGVFVPYEQAGTDSSNDSDFGAANKIEEHDENIDFNKQNNMKENNNNITINNDSDNSTQIVKKKLQRLPQPPLPLMQQNNNLEQEQALVFNLKDDKSINQNKEQASPVSQIHSHHHQKQPSNQQNNYHITYNNQQHQYNYQQFLYNANHSKQFGTDEQIKTNALVLKNNQINHTQDIEEIKKVTKGEQQQLQGQSNNLSHDQSLPKLIQKNIKNPIFNTQFKEYEILGKQQIKSSSKPASEFDENASIQNEFDEMNVTINSAASSNTTKALLKTNQLNNSSLLNPSNFKITDSMQTVQVIGTQDHSLTEASGFQKKQLFGKKVNIQKIGENGDILNVDSLSDQERSESNLDRMSDLNSNMRKNKLLPRKNLQFTGLTAEIKDTDQETDNQSLGDPELHKKLIGRKKLIDQDSPGVEEEDDFEDQQNNLRSNKDQESDQSVLSSQKSQKKLASLNKVSGTLSNKSDDGGLTNIQSEQSLSSKIRRGRRQPTQQESIFAEKLFQSSGHTLQTLFQEKMKKIHEKSIINQKYSFITSENDIVFEASEEFLVNMSEKDELCLATFFLPIIVTYDQATDTFKEEIQESSLYFHFYNSYTSLRWVGVLPNYYQIPTNLHEKLANYLMYKYRFYPIFMDNDMIDSFLNNFCFNMYDNIMTNQFDLQHFRFIEYNSKIFEEVKKISFIFAQQISKIIDIDTNIMIADYRIIFSIIYISQCRANKLSIAYFHDSQFPDIDKLMILPFGEKLINAILCSNMVSFMNFEAAQNFLKFIRVKLKLPYESIRGNLRLIYMGNQIIIHIRNPGVNIKAINYIKHQPYYEEYVTKIKVNQLNHDNQLLMLSVDTLHENNKIELKFKLYERFLQNHPDLKVQLIQIILPEQKNYSTQGNYSNKELIKSINRIANEIQKNFRSRNPLLVIYQNMGLKERLAYMKLADIFLKTSVFQENEIYPLEFVLANQQNGFIMINKFGSYNYKQIRSCIAFNPNSYYEFEKNILDIQSLSLTLKEKVISKDVEILQQFNTNTWIEKHIGELKKNAKFMSQANMTGSNKGINFKKVAHSAYFKQLNIKEATEFYRKSVRRLIIFGYVGTLVPLDKYMYIQAEEYQLRRHHQKPSEKMIENLKKLCADKRNMVYIVTELSIDFMDEWFSDVKGLGLICENGYFHKVIQEGGKPNTEWVRLIDLDMSWKEPVYRIMEGYAIRTQGSSVEVKESSVVWKYNKVNIDFGAKQAEQLIQQLQSNISQLKYLEISHHNESVEIRPCNLNKGIVAELLIERKIIECGKIDYILILGSSMTDEDMFCACQMFYRNHNKEFQEKIKPLYVTIGIKPSNAYYYIAFEEVEKVIELLVLSESFASFF
ncbi:hypothetical protein ABPG74_011342 [Tetrahymena malaccensis]